MNANSTRSHSKQLACSGYNWDDFAVPAKVFQSHTRREVFYTRRVTVQARWSYHDRGNMRKHIAFTRVGETSQKLLIICKNWGWRRLYLVSYNILLAAERLTDGAKFFLPLTIVCVRVARKDHYEILLREQSNKKNKKKDIFLFDRTKTRLKYFKLISIYLGRT